MRATVLVLAAALMVGLLAYVVFSVWTAPPPPPPSMPVSPQN